MLRENPCSCFNYPAANRTIFWHTLPIIKGGHNGLSYQNKKHPKCLVQGVSGKHGDCHRALGIYNAGLDEILYVGAAWLYAENSQPVHYVIDWNHRCSRVSAVPGADYRTVMGNMAIHTIIDQEKEIV